LHFCGVRVLASHHHKIKSRQILFKKMTKPVNEVWINCLKIIKDNVNPQSFKTWFEPIIPIKIDDSILTIQVPSQFFYEWLEEHYVSLLSKTIKRELGSNARLEYRIVVENSSKATNPYTINIPTKDAKLSIPGANSLPRPSAAPPVKNPFIIPGLKKMNIDSQLNPSYVFDNFIEGECNQLARSAGVAVANRPGGTAFNPLVFYGGVGLGKTHLLQAIGNHIKSNFSTKSVIYVSSEKFTNQFIEAVKSGSTQDFLHFYQMMDVLLVDDIQFFTSKDRTQDIFFHIFNHLHQSGKQIVLTSDKPPRELEGMEERLLSRFKWGLTADLSIPDFETRMAILEKKMYAEGIDLPHEVIEYVAYNINTNVRELEGALISLLAQASLSNKEIDISLAKRIVKNFINNISRDISIEYIQKVVCSFYDTDIDMVKGQTRKRNIVQSRQVSMYFAKQFTEYSLKAIGKNFGNRDHSTVIHSCQTVQNLLDIDENFQKEIREIEKKIKLSL